MTPSTDSWYGIVALILFVAKSLWDIYREKNKPQVDASTAKHSDAQAYSELLDAIGKSGQSMGDMLKLLGDLPAVRNQLATAEHEINELKKAQTEWTKEREEWKIGIGLLLGQLVKARITPTWLPRGVDYPDAPGGTRGGLMGAGR